jgi:hypothetical protein
MKYKNYRNSYTNEDKIYSRKNIADMSVREAFSKKNEIMAQHNSIGIPSEGELKNSPNAVWVEAYTRDDGTEVRGYWRSKPEDRGDDNINDRKVQKEENTTDEQGIATGGASRVDREKEPSEINNLPKNNDDFFEKERNNPQSVLMRVNGEKNADRPDAKLFMDIALVGPKNVPSTQDYQFISSEQNKDINEKYNLVGNKEIPSHYDGFEFNADSPTAQALNNSEEFKNQVLSSKNYDSTTRTFKTDKLEIEFNNDKNLQYSFGHMTILEPKIENGYITGTGYDKYDYEAMYGKKFENVSQETKTLNNKARFLQATGKLKNYYVLVPVKIKI